MRAQAKASGRVAPFLPCLPQEEEGLSLVDDVQFLVYLFSPAGRKKTYIKKESTMLPQAIIAFA